MITEVWTQDELGRFNQAENETWTEDRVTRDRCYDFKNIFAEKYSKKWRF
jgi:hypothetical protein